MSETHELHKMRSQLLYTIKTKIKCNLSEKQNKTVLNNFM